jgi:peptide/nickel transport system substrate-binding protein
LSQKGFALLVLTRIAAPRQPSAAPADGVCIDPTNKIIRANGQLAGNGWPSLPQVEAELASWFEAQHSMKEKAIVRRLNTAVLDQAFHPPLGVFLKHQAWRNNVTGIVKGPLPFFGGVGNKTA